MKKVLLIIIFLLCIIALTYSTYILLNTRNENNKIKKDIEIVNKKIDKLKKDNSQYEKEIDKFKKKNEDKSKELQIWEKAKEKLKKAL